MPGSEQIPWLVMPALVCPALLKAKIPVLAAAGGQTRLSPVGSHSSQGSRGKVLVREDWGVGGGRGLEGSIAASSQCCSSGQYQIINS